MQSPRLISADRASSMRSPASLLEFPRVINADRASSMHNPGSMGQDEAQPWIHGDLVGIPSSYRLRDGLQLRFPAGRLEFDRVINAGPGLDAVPLMDPWGPICSSLELSAPTGPAAAIPTGGDSMHNLGSNGRKYAQPRIQWPKVCTTMDPRAGSLQTSANIRRTSANQGQQLRSPAGRLESHRVINADRASSMHNPGSMGQHDAQPWIQWPEV
jgi:alkylated DNA nucleotide flippase Atl1